MELDDLKQTWKEKTNQKPTNKNIMEMIQHKSYGPVAALKRSYRKQILVMLLMPFLLLATNLDDISRPLTSVMYWSYVVFCIGMATLAINNYLVANRMQRMDGLLKTNLEQQITLLQTRMKWTIIGLRLALLFFVVLAEVLPYFQYYRMLDKWHSLPMLTRYGVYVGLFIAQYFLNPLLLQYKFGRHLNSLKQLASEL
jgi:hypothetical protein